MDSRAQRRAERRNREDSHENSRIRPAQPPSVRNDNGAGELPVTADTEAIPVRDLRYHRIDRLVPL